MVRMQVLLDGSVAVSPRTILCRLARLAEWRIPDLSAPFWRCYAVVAGRAELRFAGRTHALGRGRAFLIAPR